MKTIKFLMPLLIGVFLLAACFSVQGKQSLPTGISDQDVWQTYTSAKYQFTVRFPSAWQVVELPTSEYPAATDQVWFVSQTLPLPQTDSRADITFIFTQEDPSPSWMSQFFDAYQSDSFLLGDIQARKISGINKESKLPEIVVLAKLGDYYLQAMPNHGETSLEFFDQVASSIRSVQTGPTALPLSATTNLGSLEEKTIVFEGINFSYPSSLAEGASAHNIPAFIDPAGFMYDDIPEHVRFNFSNPYTTRAPFAKFQPGGFPWLKHQNPESPEIWPQIYIFPTREYAEINPLAGERIEDLKILLDGNALPTGGELPVLPTFNSTQDLRAQVYPLAFQGGRGLRFVTRYSQGVAPIVNPVVFYTFQGLTEDGSLYVAAFFPLHVPFLPDQVQVEDWDAFNRGYQDYMADITSRLEQLASNDFEPDLETFDNLIRSMSISPTPGSATITDTPSANAMQTPEPPCFVTGFSPVTFMPDGERILVRAENGIQIFNLQTMQEEAFLAAPTNLNYPAVALSPDGEILAWALEDFSIQLIRISDKKILHTLTGHTDIIGKLRFSPNGDRLFSASHDTWVRVWDMEGNLVHAFQPPGALGYPDEVLGIGISPDGTMLATIPFDGPVKLWDLKDYELVRELRGLAGGSGGYDTSDISFSPDGQLVAADTATGLFLWKTLDGIELLGGNPGINSMAAAFSPDGRLLAYGETGEKYDVVKFDVVLSSPDGTQKIRTLEGHPAPVGILFFSPDSSLLLSSDWVETRIYRVEDGQLMYVGKSACP
jgi:WD40 repeat protein